MCPIFLYDCTTCQNTREMQVKMSEQDEQFCEVCKNKLIKQFPLFDCRFKIKGFCHNNEFTKYGRNPDNSVNKKD